MVIDYSKWDNIDISDDDSEHDDLNAFKENFGLSNGFKKQIEKLVLDTMPDIDSTPVVDYQFEITNDTELPSEIQLRLQPIDGSSALSFLAVVPKKGCFMFANLTIWQTGEVRDGFLCEMFPETRSVYDPTRDHLVIPSEYWNIAFTMFILPFIDDHILRTYPTICEVYYYMCKTLKFKKVDIPEWPLPKMEFLGFNRAFDIFTQLFLSNIGTSYWIDKKYLHTFNFGITEKTEMEKFMNASLPHKAKTPLSIELLDVCTRGNSWIYYFAGDLEMAKLWDLCNRYVMDVEWDLDNPFIVKYFQKTFYMAQICMKRSPEERRKCLFETSDIEKFKYGCIQLKQNLYLMARKKRGEQEERYPFNWTNDDFKCQYSKTEALNTLKHMIMFPGLQEVRIGYISNIKWSSIQEEAYQLIFDGMFDHVVQYLPHLSNPDCPKLDLTPKLEPFLQEHDVDPVFIPNICKEFSVHLQECIPPTDYWGSEIPSAMDDSVLAYLSRQWEVTGEAQKQSYAKLPLRIKRRVVAPYDVGVLFRTGTPMYRRKAREMIARSGFYKLHNKTSMILKRKHLSTTEWMDKEYENKELDILHNLFRQRVIEEMSAYHHDEKLLRAQKVTEKLKNYGCANPSCTTSLEKTVREKLMLCARCGKTRYCSKKCQKKHWKIHKTVCTRESAV